MTGRSMKLSPQLKKLLSIVLIVCVAFFFLKKDAQKGGVISQIVIQYLESIVNGNTQPDDPNLEPYVPDVDPVTPDIDPYVPDTDPEPQAEPLIDEYGTYDSKDDVALYLYVYGHLPYNYVTKEAAEAEGWTGGSVEAYFPGKCIGGSYFGNYEGLLPKKKDREYHECDIDTLGKSSRGAKRIIYSNDGLIYYTGDHYKHFELLYGEP